MAVIKSKRYKIYHVYLFPSSELPRLTTPPKLTRHGRTAHNITLAWHPWNSDRGDTGDGPILWYSVHVRHERDSLYNLAGQLYHTNCGNNVVRACPLALGSPLSEQWRWFDPS